MCSLFMTCLSTKTNDYIQDPCFKHFRSSILIGQSFILVLYLQKLLRFKVIKDCMFHVSGLFLTYLGLYMMNGHGQPALLYLVPCTLGN